MAEWIAWAMGIEAVLTLGLAAFLAWRGFRTWATLAAVTMIAGFGVLVGFNASTFLFSYPVWASVLVVGVFALISSAEIVFAVTFAGGIREPWRSRGFGLAALHPLVWVVLVVAYFLGLDDVWMSAARAFSLVRLWVLFGATLLLAARFWLARSAVQRRHLLYGLLPFLVWFANHTSFWAPDLPPGADLFGTLFASTNLVKIATYAAIILIAAVGVARGGERRSLDAVLLAWAVVAAPLSLVQRLGFGLHDLVDGLFIVALFYGVARYQILGVDLQWRTGVGRSVMVAFAVPVFFIIQQIIEQAAGATLGALAGAIVAGLALSALYFARERLGAFVGGGRSGDPMATYLAHRRMEIYRAAVQASMVDGVVDPSESRSLEALRAELGITMPEHDAIRRDLLGLRGGAGGSKR